MQLVARATCAVGIAIVAFSGAVVATPSSDAAFRGKNGKIAFERDGDVWTMDADGSNQLDLTNNAASEGQPAWSPDGTKIAFQRDGDIWVMNADGSAPTPIVVNTLADAFPAWSADGTHIAFTRAPIARSGDVYVVRANGTDETKLTNNLPGAFPTDFGPAWSPIGDSIVFARSSSDTGQEIHQVNPALGPAAWITVKQLTSFNVIANAPNWSSDGSKIVFGVGAPGSQDVYVMNPDGSSPTSITRTPGQINGEPAFAPDATKIVFTSFRDGNYEIYVMNADGSNQVRLTRNTNQDHHPDWQPLAKLADDKTDVAVQVMETPLQVSAQQPKLDFGALFPGTARYGMQAPVKVVSGHDGGYQLWATRTSFAQPKDIPLALRCFDAAPAGATCDLGPTGGVPGTDIPTTSSVRVGHRDNATPLPAGDLWPLDVIVGPIPPIVPGQYYSILTYTAVGF